MFAHLDPVDRSGRLPAARSRAGAGVVAGHPARSARRADDVARDRSRRRSRSSRSRSAACRRPRSARSRSRSARARRARRRCRTSAIRSAASRSPAWRGSSARNAMAALENVALWHERDISHSSVERVILPDSFIALDHMLRRFTRIVAGMVVYPERMLENLGRSRGVVFSGTVLLELARRGVSREQAYEWVQRNAMRSFQRAARLQGAAAGRCRTSPRVLPRAVLDEAFDLDAQLRQRGRDLRPGVRTGRGGRWRSRRADGGTTVVSNRQRVNMKARVFVTLKPSVFDPQGHTIAEALHSLGYGDVADVRQGKYFELDLNVPTADEAREAGRGSRRSRARESGHRKLPHRAGRRRDRGGRADEVRRRRVSGIELRPRRLPRRQARARPGRRRSSGTRRRRSAAPTS